MRNCIWKTTNSLETQWAFSTVVSSELQTLTICMFLIPRILNFETHSTYLLELFRRINQHHKINVQVWYALEESNSLKKFNAYHNLFHVRSQRKLIVNLKAYCEVFHNFREKILFCCWRISSWTLFSEYNWKLNFISENFYPYSRGRQIMKLSNISNTPFIFSTNWE